MSTQQQSLREQLIDTAHVVKELKDSGKPVMIEIKLERLEALILSREREARVDELNRLYNEHNRRFDEDSCDIIKGRIGELTSNTPKED